MELTSVVRKSIVGNWMITNDTIEVAITVGILSNTRRAKN